MITQYRLTSLVVVSLLFSVLLLHYSESAILRAGKALKWRSLKPLLQNIRRDGALQFAKHYQRCRGVEMPRFLWGDEIEYGVFRRSPRCGQHFDLHPNATRIRTTLSALEREFTDFPIGCEWQAEYGAWMVESVPRHPYGSYLADLLNVEKSMQLRRKRLHSVLWKGREIAPTLSVFPMMGVEGYEHAQESGRIEEKEMEGSKYVRDAVISPHPRFAALTRNIRERRGRPVDIGIPADTEVPSLTHKSSDDVCDERDCENAEARAQTQTDTQSDMIHMDAMAFGMGCCCLQVTMQAQSERESRFLTDQLAVLAPLLQALSAATPIVRGRLAATDTRWEIISQAVDDRTAAEDGSHLKVVEGENRDDAIERYRDPLLAGEGVKPLRQSRYSAVPLFIAQPQNETELNRLRALNDVSVAIDEEIYTLLKNNCEIDDVLATHIAHLFVRDPLVVFDDAIHLDNDKTLDHFENLQSTNWRTMRWKPPSLQVGLESERRRSTTNSSVDVVSEVNTHNNESLSSEDFDFFRNVLVQDRYAEFMRAFSLPSSNTSSPSFSFVPSTPGNDEVNNITLAQLPQDDSTSLSSGNGVDPLAPTVREREPELQAFGPGWRLEFRPLEVQLTDFENAAFAIFPVLIARCLLAQGLELYVPMSCVEENMRRAQRKDAVLKEKFFFRRNVVRTPIDNSVRKKDRERMGIPAVEDMEIVEMSLDEIFNGERDCNETESESTHTRFCGLIPLVQDYINSLRMNDGRQIFAELTPYLSLLRDKASGALPTTARWLRNRIEQDPRYQGDGHVSPAMADDLLRTCEAIGMNRITCRELYGAHPGPFVQPLDLIDEEDLMFTNYTCYVKPVLPADSEFFAVRALSASSNESMSVGSEQEKDAQRALLPTEAGSEEEKEGDGEEETESKTSTGRQKLLALVQAFKNLFPSFRRRKDFSPEDRVRF